MAAGLEDLHTRFGEQVSPPARYASYPWVPTATQGSIASIEGVWAAERAFGVAGAQAEGDGAEAVVVEDSFCYQVGD